MPKTAQTRNRKGGGFVASPCMGGASGPRVSVRLDHMTDWKVDPTPNERHGQSRRAGTAHALHTKRTRRIEKPSQTRATADR